jgi:hypothetical protein
MIKKQKNVSDTQLEDNDRPVTKRELLEAIRKQNDVIIGMLDDFGESLSEEIGNMFKRLSIDLDDSLMSIRSMRREFDSRINMRVFEKSSSYDPLSFAKRLLKDEGIGGLGAIYFDD